MPDLRYHSASHHIKITSNPIITMIDQSNQEKCSYEFIKRGYHYSDIISIVYAWLWYIYSYKSILVHVLYVF